MRLSHSLEDTRPIYDVSHKFHIPVSQVGAFIYNFSKSSWSFAFKCFWFLLCSWHSALCMSYCSEPSQSVFWNAQWWQQMCWEPGCTKPLTELGTSWTESKKPVHTAAAIKRREKEKHPYFQGAHYYMTEKSASAVFTIAYCNAWHWKQRRRFRLCCISLPLDEWPGNIIFQIKNHTYNFLTSQGCLLYHPNVISG